MIRCPCALCPCHSGLRRNPGQLHQREASYQACIQHKETDGLQCSLSGLRPPASAGAGSSAMTGWYRMTRWHRPHSPCLGNTVFGRASWIPVFTGQGLLSALPGPPSLAPSMSDYLRSLTIHPKTLNPTRALRGVLTYCAQSPNMSACSGVCGRRGGARDRKTERRRECAHLRDIAAAEPTWTGRPDPELIGKALPARPPRHAQISAHNRRDE